MGIEFGLWGEIRFRDGGEGWILESGLVLRIKMRVKVGFWGHDWGYVSRRGSGAGSGSSF